MVKLLAKLGRFNTVVIFTIIAAAASIAVTIIAITILNSHGFDIRFELAIILATLVPLVVATPITWFLVSLIFRMYQAGEELRNPGSSDSLTGLLSRHAFFSSANNYVFLATREQTIFSVMMIDLDHFKLVNDKHGQAAGDAVLKHFAEVINSVTRGSDITGRLGGEEFAIVLPSTTTREAIEFSDRLHHAINKAVLKHNDSIIKYTASIGLTSFEPGTSVSIDELLARADLALYQAKREGRNQTSTFNPAIKQVATA
jgi:diguanylate cyclase (GGDEF)-like protein